MYYSRKHQLIFSFLLLAITSLFISSCSSKKNKVTLIKDQLIEVNHTTELNQSIDQIISPYRDHINQDLDIILSYSPENMDKSQGKWQTTIGNFLADITLDAAKKIFIKSHNKTVDLCILNHGGIRAPINKGNVTARTAFQVMPFENNLVVAELEGEEIIEMVEYIIKNKKAHPISGIQIDLSEDHSTYKSIKINNELVDEDKTYFVATSDYLLTGGDNMEFFNDAESTYDLNYKLRNILIDFFKSNRTIPIVIDNRIQ